MRDVVLNRRILVVSLPALENSSDSLAGLGKIVVASLRGMMAQMLTLPAEMLGAGRAVSDRAGRARLLCDGRS